VRGRFSERSGDNFQNTISIFQHIIIPKPQNSISMLLKPFVPHRVSYTFCMLTAIDLDHKPTRAAYKVRDVWPDWLLPYKLEVTQ